MADMSKILTGHIVRHDIFNKHPPPEGDKPVHLSKAGILMTVGPPVMWTEPDDNGSTLDLVHAHPLAALLQGVYFDGAITLTPTTLTPFRRILATSDAAGTRGPWTLPTAPVLIAYLKRFMGPENIRAGMSWEISFINSSRTDDLVVNFPNSINATGANTTAQSHTLTGASACTVTFMISDVIVGNELMQAFIV